MKFCKDCKYFVNPFGSMAGMTHEGQCSYYKDNHPMYSKVTGQNFQALRNCAIERSSVGLESRCGPNADYFEPRESELSWWNKFMKWIKA